MTTLPEPSEPSYADLIEPADAADRADPALAHLIGQLDRALRPHPAPPGMHAALDRLLRERTGATTTTTLSRRQALKAGAASMAILLTMGHTSPAMRAELDELAKQGPMTGARLASILRDERAQWSALLAQVGAARMEEPGVAGEWSVKELIAHLTWYDGAVVEGARQIQGTGTFTRRGAGEMMNDRNARLAAESRARPLADVLAESDQVFGQLLALVAASPTELLNDPRHVGLPDDVVPWMLVANNTYAHLREHAEDIRAWLNRQTPGG